MKKIVISYILFFTFLAGCISGQIRVVKDELKDSSIVIMEDYYYSAATIFFKAKKVDFKYCRKFEKNNITNVHVDFFLDVSENSINLENKIVFKVNSYVKELSLSGIKSENKRYSRATTTSDTSIKKGMVSFGEQPDVEIKVETQVDAYNYKTFTGSFELDKELENEILNSKTVKFQYYLDSIPCMYEISGLSLENLKEFLSYPCKI